jgi:hypothetical protein
MLLAACASQTKHLAALVGISNCLNTASPAFQTELYRASVDVYGNHISGLMFFKTMPDSSQNVVFATETGLTFFNFSWSKSGEFKVQHVIEKLDRKVVINLLRKDLELILIPSTYKSRANAESDKTHSVEFKKEKVFFYASEDCQSLEKAEVRHGNTIKTKVSYFPVNKNIPDSVNIEHLNFNMQLTLGRIERNASQ